MRKILSICVLLGAMGVAQAAPQPVVPVADYPKQNTISYQLSVEKWVNTDSAKVDVVVNASLDQQGMQDLQQKIEQNLASIAKADWRIVQFNRQESQSGLETVNVLAEARIPTVQIGDIRKKAEDLTKPGMKYQVSDISYAPTMDEMQKAEMDLRNQIYQQVHNEIEELDKTYKNQDFYVSDIEFMTGGMPMPRAKYADNAAGSVNMVVRAPMAASPGNVSQKITMNAVVTVASTVD